MSLIHCWEGTATAASPAVVAPGYPRAELSLVLALHRKSFNSSVIYFLFLFFNDDHECRCLPSTNEWSILLGAYLAGEIRFQTRAGCQKRLLWRCRRSVPSVQRWYLMRSSLLIALMSL